MIPEVVDWIAILDVLNGWGWKDFHIEEECRFARGYVAHVRSGRIKSLSYHSAARLLNFHERNVPRGTIGNSDHAQSEVLAETKSSA